MARPGSNPAIYSVDDPIDHFIVVCLVYIFLLREDVSYFLCCTRERNACIKGNRRRLHARKVSEPLSELEAKVDVVHFDTNLLPLLTENKLCLKITVGIRRT